MDISNDNYTRMHWVHFFVISKVVVRSQWIWWYWNFYYSLVLVIIRI